MLVSRKQALKFIYKLFIKFTIKHLNEILFIYLKYVFETGKRHLITEPINIYPRT